LSWKENRGADGSFGSRARSFLNAVTGHAPSSVRASTICTPSWRRSVLLRLSVSCAWSNEGENLTSDRVSFVAAKKVLSMSSLLYVNSPTRRNPAKATRQTIARFRSFLSFAVIKEGWDGNVVMDAESFMTISREIGLLIRALAGNSLRAPSIRRRKCLLSKRLSSKKLSM